MNRERLLDVSDLEPPEPMERALEVVSALPEGCYVRMLHRREPMMLYPILEERGYDWYTRADGQASFQILIWRRGDAVAAREAAGRADR